MTLTNRTHIKLLNLANPIIFFPSFKASNPKFSSTTIYYILCNLAYHISLYQSRFSLGQCISALDTIWCRCLCTKLKLKPIKINFIIIRGMLYATITQDNLFDNRSTIHFKLFESRNESMLLHSFFSFLFLLFIKNSTKFLNIFIGGALPTYHNKYINYHINFFI